MNPAAQQLADLGWHCLIAGDNAAAETHFRAALTHAPSHPELLVGLAQIMRRAGQLRDAVLHCDAAIQSQPDYALAWLERAFVLTSGGSIAAARHSFERAIALDPASAQAQAGLAALLVRDGDSVAGRAHAEAALDADPGNIIATGALATMELEAGRAAEARDLVAPVLATLETPDPDRVMLANLLGEASSKLGEYGAAHAAYAASKADFAAFFGHRYPSAHPHRQFIAGIALELADNGFPAVPISPAASTQAAAHHLFLLGYPRSGTTMVENILASLPDVVALEERPTLGEADRAFLAEPRSLARFAALSAAELAPYQQAYWDYVAQAGIAAPGQCFVDMDPLKATRLPLIARLFPAAKILIMRRDPRDVVWSCFKTNFVPTTAAMDYTTLEGAARHYAAMMEMTELARARLDLAFHEVRYEALVREFDRETRAMCAFAGLTWSEDLRRFDKTAQKRGVSTASAGQVRRGLYDGSGQWRPYARYFEPVLPILAPWIERYGYA